MKAILISILFVFVSQISFAQDLSQIILSDLISQRPDLVADIKAGRDVGTSAILTEKDKENRLSQWTEERRDLDNALLGRRVNEYIYYQTGEIDTITQSVYDSNNKLTSKKTIKHYIDERQPTVSVQDIGQVEP